MKRHYFTAAMLLLAVLVAGMGCARAARDTSGFALHEESAVNASFEETWHAVKLVLREQGYEVYTRDKRGIFVAYTPMKRLLWMQPRRTKFTIELARTNAEETAISVESIRQVYGVTLLTHPGWHDRKQKDSKASQAILEALQAKISEGSVTVEEFVDVPEEPAETEDTAAAAAPEIMEADPAK